MGNVLVQVASEIGRFGGGESRASSAVWMAYCSHHFPIDVFAGGNVGHFVCSVVIDPVGTVDVL